MPEAPDNLLLRALTGERYAALRRNLKAVTAKIGDVLFEPEDAIRYVYFPTGGTMISMIHVLKDGTTSEVGVVGPEGMVGVDCLMRSDRHRHRGLVQSGGTLFRADATSVFDEFNRAGQLQDLLLRYLHTFFTQITQTAACNRLHQIEQRLARWLLISHDYVGSNEIPTTHDFIAQMLGIRRPGVTTAIAALTVDVVIHHSRNKITIRDRAALEAIACECYATVRTEVRRTLGI